MLNTTLHDPFMTPYLDSLTEAPMLAPDISKVRADVSLATMSSDELEGIAGFSSHALADLKDANLMDRVDTKFLIPRPYLPSLLTSLRPYYSALEIDKQRLFTYHNTYFDTADYRFYHQHHQGKLNRYKVRHRHYLDTNTSFLEVKFKNNKGRTIKSRIHCEIDAIESQESQDFLQASLGDSYDSLQASQWGSYNRIALANEQEKERLTLDLNLHFSASRINADIDLKHFFIAELKQSKYNLRSAFYRQMCELGIRPTKFSKYCIGCSLVLPELKRNRFKSQLMSVSDLH